MDLESPRVSFSRDFVEAGGFETERCSYAYSPDFDFNNRLERDGNGNGMLRSADQIFQNGKFVPFQAPIWQATMKQHLRMETEGKGRQARPPPLVTCSSRWKEMLWSPRRSKPEKERDPFFRRSCSTKEPKRSSSCAEPLLGRSISDSRLSCCFARDAVIVAQQPKCKSHPIQHRSHRISAADSPNLRRNRSPKEELALASRKRTSAPEKRGSRVQAADLKQRSRSGRYIIPDVANLEVAPVLNMPVCMRESFVVSTVSKLKLFDMQILPFSSRKAKASKPTKPTAAAA